MEKSNSVCNYGGKISYTHPRVYRETSTRSTGKNKIFIGLCYGICYFSGLQFSNRKTSANFLTTLFKRELFNWVLRSKLLLSDLLFVTGKTQKLVLQQEALGIQAVVSRSINRNLVLQGKPWASIQTEPMDRWDVCWTLRGRPEATFSYLLHSKQVGQGGHLCVPSLKKAWQ